MIIRLSLLLTVQSVSSAYVAVFDAGSTGTRLKVYHFQNDRLISEVVLEPNPKNELIKGKGIQDMRPAEIKTMVNSMAQKADEIKKRLPIEFYATAGMRLSPIEIQRTALEAVKAGLKEYNLYKAKVLSGYEEALYTLRAYEYYYPKDVDVTIIDMGGRSVQIIHKKGNHIQINSLEMGILNSDCSKQKNSMASNLVEPSVKATEFLINAIDCIEIMNNNMKAYKCREKYIFNSFGDYKHKNTTPVTVDTVGLDFGTKYQLFPILDLSSNMIGSEMNEGKNFSGSTIANISCIDNFIEKGGLTRLTPTQKVILLSFYEELFTKSGVATISKFLEKVDKKCAMTKDDVCTRLYYSTKFLEKLGITFDKELTAINKQLKINITWTMGVAIDMNSGIINSH